MRGRGLVYFKLTPRSFVTEAKNVIFTDGQGYTKEILQKGERNFLREVDRMRKFKKLTENVHHRPRQMAGKGGVQRDVSPPPLSNYRFVTDSHGQNLRHTRCIYRVFINYCVFSLKFCDFSELCQFCCRAGALPAIWQSKHEVRCTH